MGWQITENLKAPFPYFGGKSTIAYEVWQRLGDVPNYVEPFVGSAAVLLARPRSHRWWDRIETINDKDGFVSNYWRATQHDPETVAHWADWPVNENDLHARHAWLVSERERLQARLEGDPEFYDAKVAGWWLWGICIWIGGGWCSGKGPWIQKDGELVRDLDHEGDAGRGIKRERTHLGGGRGINRQRTQLRNAGEGIKRQRTQLGNAGMGINRQITHLGAGSLCADWTDHLEKMMRALRDRLRRVRVECGDWERVCGDSPTVKLGLTGVFLDPPYSLEAERDEGVYAVDDLKVAHDVREWAIERGDNPLYRIALCGYEGEHEMPGWTEWTWTAQGGYGRLGNGAGRTNRYRERVWFSPHCLPPLQERLL